MTWLFIWAATVMSLPRLFHLAEWLCRPPRSPWEMLEIERTLQELDDEFPAAIASKGPRLVR